MSLDVYLTLRGARTESSSGIFVREGGRIRELSREEWDRAFPGVDPVVADTGDDDAGVFSANITHNLNTMAGEAGIYQHLWRPEELGIDRAHELIGPLREGLALLVSDPARFRAFNPSNGWGDYEGLVEFVREYLAACEKWPTAAVYASR